MIYIEGGCFMKKRGNGLQDLAREVDAEAAAANKSVSGQRLAQLTRRKPCYFKTENTLPVYWFEG